MVFMIFVVVGFSPFPAAESDRHVDAAAAVAPLFASGSSSLCDQVSVGSPTRRRVLVAFT
ncbi:MAG: hypothetical protein ACRDRF_10170 [Pseudonocardiaceae bacterium]